MLDPPILELDASIPPIEPEPKASIPQPILDPKALVHPQQELEALVPLLDNNVS